MAKPSGKSTTKKKVKKTVVDGIAHIHASFNNTIVTTNKQVNKKYDIIFGIVLIECKICLI